MRNILAAALLTLPTLASAQALHTGISHLVASVDAPAFAFQASAISTVTPRISTGLIAPIRLNALTLDASKSLTPGTVTVEYTVDALGVPENVHVVDAADKKTGDSVAAAVQNVRYRAGKLNGKPVAVPVVMHVDVR